MSCRGLNPATVSPTGSRRLGEGHTGLGKGCTGDLERGTQIPLLTGQRVQQTDEACSVLCLAMSPPSPCSPHPHVFSRPSAISQITASFLGADAGLPAPSHVATHPVEVTFSGG